MEANLEVLEPVFGGFLRVWSNGGKFPVLPYVRARARRGGAILCSIPPFHPLEEGVCDV
jgi:hypothetical protein